MADELARLQRILETGQRLARQGSYERREPEKEAIPYLVEARRGLRRFVREYPESVEAWLALSFAEEYLLNYPAARQSLDRYLLLGGERSKKTLKRLVNLKQYEERWAVLLLTPAQLGSLGAFLELELAKSECDHSHSLTETWLKEHLKTKQALALEAVKKYGGHCDCEVLFNLV